MAYLIHLMADAPRLKGIPCWCLPILAGTTWLVMLMSLLFAWPSEGSPRYVEMLQNQNIAYISDTATSSWGKPLFVAGSTLTIFLFGLSFGVERWLRHQGRLVHVRSKFGAVCTALALLFTFCGSMGLFTLAIFDVRRYPSIHFPMLGVFVVGFLIAAAFMAAERKLHSKRFAKNVYIRRSFKVKLVFIAVELAFVFLFALWALMAGPLKTGPYADLRDPSVVAEWFLGFVFGFYMCSFAIDFFAVPELVDDQAPLVCNPSKLWDEVNVDIDWPGMAWGRSKKENVVRLTRLVRVEEPQFCEIGRNRCVGCACYKV